MPKPKRKVGRTALIKNLVRQKLKAQYGKSFFPNRPVKNRRLPIDPNGKILHTFYLVSEDKEIVGEIKSVSITTEQAYNTTRAKRVLVDCYFLDKVKAKKKILVLTNKEFYDRFKSDFETVVKPIEIMYFNVEK